MNGLRVSYQDRVKGIISEYEEIVLGKRKSFSYWYFSGSAKQDEEIVLELLRFAFEKLLHWTPQTLYEQRDEELLSRMHLANICARKIKRNPTMADANNKDKETWYQFLAKKLYPEKFKKDIRAETIQTFEDVLSGRLIKIPKNMFDGDNGLVRLGICLQYVVTTKLAFDTLEDMYEAFGEHNIVNELIKYKLWIPCQRYFETPVDFLHFSLPARYRNELCYVYTKRKYYKNRVVTGNCKDHIADYIKMINGEDNVNVLYDSLGTAYPDVLTVCFSYCKMSLLAEDKMVMQILEKEEKAEICDAVDMYELMLGDYAEFILDKYCLLDAMKALSGNYVEAVDCMLPTDERDPLAYRYAVDRFKRNERSRYHKMPAEVRKYIAVIDGRSDMAVDEIITNHKTLTDCLNCIKRYYVGLDDEFNGTSFPKLLKNKKFLEKYRLTDVIKYAEA